jgi:deoxycytidine triphosphate deaminase
MSNSQESSTTRRQQEVERLIALHGKCPGTDENFPYTGVLLSDAIKYCIDKFDLIRPFDENNLKPANYKLTIGDEYAIGGAVAQLSDISGQNELRIAPFQVAVIKTRERINMPPFLIGRWNIRVQLAYKGLLWVGGPQVDAGYVGHLFCPIYNLSGKEVVLHYGDSIAVIDFVRTSKITDQSLKYKPVPPERVLLEDYEARALTSGLYEIATEKISGFEKQLTTLMNDSEDRMTSLQARVDTFVVVTFTIIAVLFAAVTIFVARAEQQALLWDLPVLFLLNGSAVFMSLLWMKSRNEGRSRLRMFPVVVILLFIVVTGLQFWEVGPLKGQIESLQTRIEQLSQQVKTLSDAPPKASQLKPSSTPPAKTVPTTQEQKLDTKN